MGQFCSLEVRLLKFSLPSQNVTRLGLAALLAVTFALGVFIEARASTVPRDEDVFFRRFRGADEVDGRGGSGGSGSSHSGGSGSSNSGSGSSGSGGGSSGSGSSGSNSGSSGSGNASGSGKGGSSGGDHNSNDDDDRFKK
jgi:hypothetical protein